MVATVHLDEVDSTNAEAMRRAAAGERGPVWITARRQTAGKGRSGRSWGTPDGNLAASLLFTPGCLPAALAGLSLVTGIAAWETVAAVLPRADELRLKWPNDLMLGTAKLAGCLIESTVLAGATLVVIGVGINVAVAPTVPGRAVTCLAEHGTATDAAAAFSTLQGEMTRWLAVWNRGVGFAEVRAAWLGRALALGHPISVNTGMGVLAGTFAGLADDGALLLREPDGAIRRTAFGDVSLEVPARLHQISDSALESGSGSG